MRWLVSAGVGAVVCVVGVAQVLVGGFTLLRLLRRLPGPVIRPATGPAGEAGVTAVVPVLNEAGRLAPCLVGLAAQGLEVAEVLVVDGGSTDATVDVVNAAARKDPRIRWLQAGRQPEGWNGKLWNLAAGVEAAKPSHHWLLTVDADVRPQPGLVAALVAHAEQRHLHAVSIATEQRLSSASEGLLHPAMLTTLVYRFGAPGRVATGIGDVQANGQCMLLRTDALRAIGGFQAAYGSTCEDVTLARALVAAGLRVGFYRAPGLVDVAMYQGAVDTWANWPRSLPLRDHFTGTSALMGLAQVTLVQAFPLALLGLSRWLAQPAWMVAMNRVLLALRLGLLAGIAPAYPSRPITYWLSPLLDLPVAAALWRSAFTRHHTWRGRTLTPGGSR